MMTAELMSYYQSYQNIFNMVSINTTKQFEFVRTPLTV